MTGIAQVEVNAALRRRLAADPAVCILAETEVGENGLYWLTVRSALLAPDCHGAQEVVLEGGKIRFKRWADT